MIAFLFGLFSFAAGLVIGILVGKHNPDKAEELDARFNEFRKKVRAELEPYLDKLDEKIRAKLEELFK